MKKIYSQFRYEGMVVSCTRYGSGHINETYLVVTQQPHLYILQKLSTQAFKDIPALMQNVAAITDHLYQKNPDPRRTLQLIPTQDWQLYYRSPECEYWRSYEFVLSSLCLDKPESNDDLYQSGVAFGDFQKQLADFPAATLHETIRRFMTPPTAISCSTMPSRRIKPDVWLKPGRSPAVPGT